MFENHPERGKICELCGGFSGSGCPRLSCNVCDYHLCQHCRIPGGAFRHKEIHEVEERRLCRDLIRKYTEQLKGNETLDLSYM